MSQEFTVTLTQKEIDLIWLITAYITPKTMGDDTIAVLSEKIESHVSKDNLEAYHLVQFYNDDEFVEGTNQKKPLDALNVSAKVHV